MRLHRWSLARDYLNRALPIQDRLLTRKPYFITRLEHATLLREMAASSLAAPRCTEATGDMHPCVSPFSDRLG